MPKKLKPIQIDAMTVWQSQKPRYNGYVGGYGVHGKTKYSRKEKYKTNWKDYA